MSQFEEACRPVVFAHDDPEFSYWTKGSSFLISNKKNYFWVTAAHVLVNPGGRAKSVRIFPSDNSKISLPFDEQYTVNKGLAEDEDYKDIFILRVDLNGFDRSGDAPLLAQDIEQGVSPAEYLEQDDELWVVGYPSESNGVDYDAREIKNTRSVLRGIYKGPSASDHCHKINIESSVKLISFDGLSGGPVFHMKQQTRDGETAIYPMLVGMLLRGTASSGIAHFVSSSVIVNIVNLVEEQA